MYVCMWFYFDASTANVCTYISTVFESVCMWVYALHAKRTKYIPDTICAACKKENNIKTCTLYTQTEPDKASTEELNAKTYEAAAPTMTTIRKLK